MIIPWHTPQADVRCIGTVSHSPEGGGADEAIHKNLDSRCSLSLRFCYKSKLAAPAKVAANHLVKLRLTVF